MEELHNQLLAATDPLEIIEISDKILNERSRRYLKHTFLKGESLLSLGKFDEALSIFEQILEYDDDRFTGRAHNSIGFCYSMKNKPRKAESEFKKARKYCDESSLLLNSATLNMATYYSMTNKKEDAYKIFKELWVMNPSNRLEDSYMLVLMSSNNPQEFIETYDLNIDESFPKDEQVMARKAIALMDLERFEEAIPILDDALKYTDDKEGLKIIHFHLGVSYYRLGELDKASCEFEKTREYNDDPSLLLQIANCYEMVNQNEKALDVLKEYSEIVPDNEDIKKKIENLKRESNEPDSDEIYNNKCLTLINLNRFDEAIECYDKALKINPNNVKAWNNKAFALHNLNRLDEAIECYNKSLEIDPNFISSLRNKAFALRTLNRLDEAIECYDKVLKIDPNDFGVWNNKAFSLHELNRSDEAIECYDEALKINPNYFEAWANKGFTLESLGRLDEAIECYNNALEIYPNHPDMLNRLSVIESQKNVSVNSLEDALNQADTYWEEKEYEKVIEVYDLISDSMPKQPLVWNRKGDAYYQLGRYEEAIECFDKAFEYNPHFPFPLYYKTLSYMNLEDYENAENTVVQALMFFPDSPGFLNNYCVILNKLGKYEEALDAADKALISNPNSVETYTNKAHALKKLCEIDEALECYNKALKIDPNIIDAWLDKADALKDFEMFDEALECYKEALTHFPHNPDILHYMSVLYLIKGDLDNSSKCLEESKKYSDL